MKRVLMLTAVALAAMGLTGCSYPQVENVEVKDNTFSEIFTVRLDDGRSMDCIFLRQGQAQSSVGGPSCDWENAK